MKKALKMVGIIIIIIVLLIIALFAFIIIRGKIEASKPVVDADYQEQAKTGGPLENKYLLDGAYEIASYEKEMEAPSLIFEVWYPKELETTNRKYPVIVYCNGSGVTGKRIEALFKHWASWGFIVIGNEDQSTWSGESAEQTLSLLLGENETEGSLFFGKIDEKNIGITGHSQGGVGVFNAITAQPHSSLYKTAVPVSPTQEELAEGLGWPYDLAKIQIPVLMLAGTGEADANTVIPLDKMTIMYDKIPADKVMARKTGIDHELTDSDMDGYVTAWFMWQLQGDGEAAAVFTGDTPELMTNPLYQDQIMNLTS